MKKVFIGLLVGVCVIMFSLPLMAADTPKGLDPSSLQAVTDAQLVQMRGQGYDTWVPGLQMQYDKYYPMEMTPPYLNGLAKAGNIHYDGKGESAVVNSRAFNDGVSPK